MKRSEMLDRIACFIHQHRRVTMEWTSDKMADEILKICKEAGMLEPKINVGTPKDGSWSKNYFENKWEEE